MSRRMEAMGPSVIVHGRLAQGELSDLMRTCSVCVLPSFFEGLGLVLVEALACGCRLVSTDLEGVREELAPHLGSALDLVPLPRLRGADRPVREDLPSFVIALEEGLGGALGKPPLEDPETAFSEALARFTWEAVFRRVEAVWEELCEG